MKEIDITQWAQIGEGGNGATFVNNAEPGVLLKVSYLELAQADELVREFQVSKAIEELGVSTPRMLELVSVNGRSAIKSQAIPGKKSFARLCHDNPDKLDDYAVQMAGLARRFHATAAAGNKDIPSMKALMTEAVSSSEMLSSKAKKHVQEFVDSLEDAPNLLHGDFTFSNLIQADEKAYWIDLGRATHGLPYFDLGHFYLFCNIFGRQKRVQEITHMTDAQMARFWDTFAREYAGTDDITSFNNSCKRFAALDIVLLGHIQTLTFSERFFLGMLAKKMIKA